MPLTELSRLLEEVLDITEKCFDSLRDKSMLELEKNLSKRSDLISQLEISAQTILPELQSEEQKVFFATIFKNLAKESERLVEYIDREKKGVVQDIKQLQNGKKNLDAIKQKLNKSRFVSKII